MSDEEIKGMDSPDPEKDAKPERGLKEAREAKGLSLRDLSAITRLSPSILTAIENEKFNGLPEPVYTKAFIATCAKALNVDADGILSRYEDYRKNLRRQREAEAEIAAQSKKGAPSKLIVLVMLLLVLISLSVYQRYSGFSIQIPVVETKEGAITEEPPASGSGNIPAVVTEEADTLLTVKEEADVGGDTGTETAAKVEERLPVASVNPHTGIAERPLQQIPPMEAVKPEFRSYRLEIEATEWTWLEITIDERSPFEIMLKPGDKMVRTASKKVMMIVGNAGGVNVTFDDEPLGSLGRHGEVIFLTLPKGDE